jgi:hypothetical protein
VIPRAQFVTVKVQFAAACGNDIRKPHAVFLLENQDDLSEPFVSLIESRLAPNFEVALPENRNAPSCLVDVIPDQGKFRPVTLRELIGCLEASCLPVLEKLLCPGGGA